MKNISYLGLCLLLCSCKTQTYNCYALDWDTVAMHDVPQPMLYIKNDWKNINRHQAKQAFENHMSKQCRENPDIGYHCEEKTANSFVPVYKNIMSSGTSSMFCIPLNRDMNGMAEKYVNEEIEIYSGAKTLFPFDE